MVHVLIQDYKILFFSVFRTLVNHIIGSLCDKQVSSLCWLRSASGSSNQPCVQKVAKQHHGPYECSHMLSIL